MASISDFGAAVDVIIAGASVISGIVVAAAAYVRKISSMVNKVHGQLVPNGGSSLKDAVTRIEERIGRIETFQHASLAITGRAYWLSDSNGYCTYASPRLCERIGAAQEQVMGLGWISFIAQEDRDTCRREWLSATGDMREFHMPYTVISADGVSHKVWGHAVPMASTADGKSDGFIGWIEPLTASQRNIDNA